MKKVLLLAFALVVTFGFSQPLPSGIQAPDFTITDINGNTVDLSDILDSGKSVYLDISATWCPPCWGFHEAHIFDDIYYTYGPGGSDEVVPLFIEGDPSTTMEDLYGTGGNTQGDWVTGAPYHIVNDDNFISTYTISGWPTFYVICPDGTLNHWDQTVENAYLTPDILPAYLNTKCGSGLVGVANHAKVELPEELYICGEGSTDIEASIVNFGNNDISSATVELHENDVAIASQEFSGSIGGFEEGEVEFGSVAISSDGEYKVVLTSINGVAPYSSDANVIEDELDFVIAEQVTSSEIQVVVNTDSWPSEISWNITDSSGNVIVENSYSGPDQTGPDANTTFTYDVTLPDGNDCYSVNYYDSYGDGWGSNANAGIQVISNGETVYSEQVGNFGSELERDNAFGADVLGVNDVALNSKFAIYPNPSTGVINLKSTEEVNITVTNMTGKKVASYKAVDANATLDLSHLPKGIYILQVDGDNTKGSKKLIIK